MTITLAGIICLLGLAAFVTIRKVLRAGRALQREIDRIDRRENR